MLGANCARFGRSTSRKRSILRFELPFPAQDDEEETIALFNTRTILEENKYGVILRTRELTAELLKRSEGNDVHFCARHFKAESFVDHN